MPRPRIVGGSDPEPPDPIRTLAPLAGTPPYTRSWWAALARLMRTTFAESVREGARRSP